MPLRIDFESNALTNCAIGAIQDPSRVLCTNSFRKTRLSILAILVEAYKGTRRKHMKFRQIGHTTSQYEVVFSLKLLVHGTGLLSLFDPGMSLNCAPARVCRKSVSRPGYVVKVGTDPGYVVKQCPRIVMNKICDWH